MYRPNLQAKLLGGTTTAIQTVYCIGRNYAEHAKELGNPLPKEPVVFLKSKAALRDLEPGELAFADESFHHEAELVLLLGKDVDLGEQAGWEAVSAIGLGLDLTRRERQTELKSLGLPWTTAKSFAGSGLLSTFVPIARFPDLKAINFTLNVNGDRRQQGSSRDMLFQVPALLTYLASLNRLVPGDIIYTGTPKGVGPLRKGDTIELALPDLALSFKGQL